MNDPFERFEEVDAIVQRALELDDDERASFLEDACASEGPLRAQVDRLLSDIERGETLEPALPRSTASEGTDPLVDLIGRSLSHYEVTRHLASGGMGDVYLARDTQLKRDVAVKILPAEVAQDPSRLARFRREAEALAALNHPGIVQVHELGEADDLAFLVMELVRGRTLAEALEAGPLPLERFSSWARSLADALAAAHESGVIHRDLKPANIMVSDTGQLKVLDFGLARRTAAAVDPTSQLETLEMTRVGTVLGTLPYMSPEQVDGAPVDHRSDLFSLGAVLHEMATGRRAFEGTSAAQLSSAILRDPPSMEREELDIAPEIAQIVLRCLEKDPAARFQSAAELRDALDAAGSDHPPTARRKGLLLLAATAATVVVVLIGWTLLFEHGTRDRSPSSLAGSAESSSVEPTPDRLMLVVLPFENLNHDPDQDYFAEGLAAELSTHIASLDPDRLSVIARTSARSYRDTSKSIAQIAHELSVDYVLEGTVERRPDQVIVRTQLVDARDQVQVWSESYERDEAELFTIQSEIAARIAGSLVLEVSPRFVEIQRKTSPAAYDAYLEATYRNALSIDGLTRQIRGLERAIELDPGFAEAYARLAAAHHLLASGGMRPDRQAYPKAREAALRAIELDTTLAGAWSSLGFIACQFDWDWAEAEAAFARSFELGAGDHHLHALYLHAMGRHQEALEAMTITVERDPLSFLARYNLGKMLLYAGREEHALRELEALAALLPDSVFGAAPAEVFWHQGRYEEAVQLLEQAFAATGGEAPIALRLAYSYALAGRAGDAHRVLGQLEAQQGLQSPVLAAVVAGQLGERDRAFELLEIAFELRDDELVVLNVEHWFESLRDDPRFDDLVQRMEFPDSPP